MAARIQLGLRVAQLPPGKTIGLGGSVTSHSKSVHLLYLLLYRYMKTRQQCTDVTKIVISKI